MGFSLDFISPFTGLATDFLGEVTGANDAVDAANAAAAQIQFNPFNINSLLGGVSYDPATKTLTTSASDDVLNAAKSLFGLASQGEDVTGIGRGLLDQGAAFDTNGFAQNITQRLRDLAAPKEERDRRTLESRLFKQGLLSSTPGAETMGQLFDAQSLADSQRTLTGFLEAGKEQNRLFDAGNALLTTGANTTSASTLNALSALGLPDQLLGPSLSAATGDTSAAQSRAGIVTDAAKILPGILSSAITGAVSAYAGKQ